MSDPSRDPFKSHALPFPRYSEMTLLCVSANLLPSGRIAPDSLGMSLEGSRSAAVIRFRLLVHLPSSFPTFAIVIYDTFPNNVFLSDSIIEPLQTLTRHHASSSIRNITFTGFQDSCQLPALGNDSLVAVQPSPPASPVGDCTRQSRCDKRETGRRVNFDSTDSYPSGGSRL